MCSSSKDEDCGNIKRPEPARTCNLQLCANWKSGSWSKVGALFPGVRWRACPSSARVLLSHFPHLPASVQTAVGWQQGDTGMSSVWILRASGPSDPFTVRMAPADPSAHWRAHKSPV